MSIDKPITTVNLERLTARISPIPRIHPSVLLMQSPGNLSGTAIMLA